MIQRHLKMQILQDLEEKMVFIGGPRQVGKTTLARSLGTRPSYLNWDYAEDRQRILKGLLPDTPLWILDEIHKYKSWRNYLKGLYDKFGEEKKILVTGSARLDLLRRGGDSLQGRYHFLRLYPLTLDELGSSSTQDLDHLFQFSGFPEPFLAGNLKKARRWSMEYRQRVLQDDISSVERIEELGKAEHLLINLTEKVGSPLSLNALREDLDVSHRAVTRWMDLFEKFYALFTLIPFGAKGLRAVKKERKHYHYDWTLIEEPGLRLENMVACHLLKRIHFLNDTEGRNFELRYFRDFDQREVDFVIVERKALIAMIEVKWKESTVSPSLLYLKRKYPQTPAYQVVYNDKNDFLTKDGIRLLPARRFLSEDILQIL